MRTIELESWPCQLVEHDYSLPGDLPRPHPIEDRASLVFADPPYNLGIKYADDPTRDKMSLEQYQDFTLNTLSSLIFVARPGATLWWMTPEEHADWTGDMLRRLIGPRLYRIVWHEPFAQYQGNRGLTKDYRFIFVHRFGTSGGEVTFNPDDIRVPSVRQQMGDKRANPNGRVPGCVWNFRRLQGTSVDRVDWHPCQLPPELLQRIVKGWSNPGDLVIDAFAGSGSMGQVCKPLGRRFMGVDRSPTYIDQMAETLA